jgi:pyruvate/2-oxoglutarate dehydrogenase complex dihydrolipoamide dehydrogenase (E3) component
MEETFDVIVIGGGPAGVTAALRARELGAGVALVERGRLGGTCTNDGCVPTRVLARAARLVRDARQFVDYGLTAEAPRLDFRRLLSRTQQVVYRVHEKKQLLDHLDQARIRCFAEAGEVHFIDAHRLHLGSGPELRGEKFVLCAGGRPRRFAFPGSEHARTHSDVWTLERVPRRLAIVGASATGCQLASIFAAFGAEVMLLEAGPRVLGREDHSVSQTMQEAFQRRGMHVLTGIEGLERIERAPTGLSLRYQHNGVSDHIEADEVILAVGWSGNADALNLESAGVEVRNSYVVVDDFLQTTAPHIFAAGDIIGRMMLVQSAAHEARLAAEHAVLGVGQPFSHHVVPHGGFTDPEYAGVGLTEEEARARGPLVVATVPYHELDRAVVDDRLEGFCKLIVSEETHRLLGAHVVGEQALEVVQIVAAGMASDMWVEQLAELELAYPTYTGIVGLAARQIVRQLGVVPLAAEWQTLGRLKAAEWERSDRGAER